MNDREWLVAPAPLDLDRIKLPPEKTGFFGTNWRRRYVFDVQLPPAEAILAARQQRAKRGSHLVDQNLTLDIVQRQVEVYARLASFFHRCGLRVYVRDSFAGHPRCLVNGAEGLAGCPGRERSTISGIWPQFR